MAHQAQNIKPFYLNFNVNGTGTEWIDHDLPLPHYLHHKEYSYIVAWAIAGYFGTPKSKEFLLDVVARFLLVFPDATRLPYAPTPKENTHNLNREPYELKAIAEHLPSLPWTHEDTKLASFVDIGISNINKERVANQSAEDRAKGIEVRMVSEDALFEATRHHLYRRAYAEGTTDNITLDYVQVMLETENQLLAKPKGRGDIRSKAKRMAKYMQNEFVIYDNIQGYAEWSKEQRNAYMREYRQRKGLVMATRTEHIKKVHQSRNLKAKAKIREVLEDMFLREDVYTKTGRPKAIAIAKLLDMSRNTVSKHLKEMGLL